MYIIVLGCTGAIMHMAEEKMYCVYGKIEDTEQINIVMRTQGLAIAQLFNAMHLNKKLMAPMPSNLCQTDIDTFNMFYSHKAATLARCFYVEIYPDAQKIGKEPEYKYQLYEKRLTKNVLVAEFVNKTDAVNFMNYMFYLSHSTHMEYHMQRPLPDKNTLPKGTNCIEIINTNYIFKYMDAYFIQEMD